MDRRKFCSASFGVIGAFSTLCDSSAQGVVKPFVIRIVRVEGWYQLMQREVCIPSTVYAVDADRILSDVPGNKVCYAMELPNRANQNEISAIPKGTYNAAARISEHNGPVIELDVPRRPKVQIHAGNQVDDTLGCLLLGSSPVTTTKETGQGILVGKCWIAGSKDARKLLLNTFGWSDLSKPPPARGIVVVVQ